MRCAKQLKPVDNLWITLDTPEQRGTNMALTSTFNKLLDNNGTLSRQRLSEAHLEPPKRLVRGVLIAIGIALCSAAPAGQATISQPMTPFRYSTSMIGEQQTECLFRIAIKESNIRYNAINRSSGAYGAWQFLTSKAKGTTAHEQVLLAIDYANYRYGSPCKAWAFWQRNYWW